MIRMHPSGDRYATSSNSIHAYAFSMYTSKPSWTTKKVELALRGSPGWTSLNL